MSLAENGYEAQIPGFPEGTTVYYKIIAYDYAGNYTISGNFDEYYVYTVVPEFPASYIFLSAILLLTMLYCFFKKKN